MGGLPQNPIRIPSGRFNDTEYGSFWKVYYNGYSALSFADVFKDGFDIEALGSNALHWGITEGGAGENFFTTRFKKHNGQSWNRPTIDAEVAKPSKIVTSMSHKRFQYGGYKISLTLQNLSPYQVFYWYDRMFDNTLGGLNTISIFDRWTNSIKAFSGDLWFPDMNDVELNASGVATLPITMVNAVELPVGPLLTPYIIDGSLPVGLTYSLGDLIPYNARFDVRKFWENSLTTKRYYTWNVTNNVVTGIIEWGFANYGDQVTYDDASISYESTPYITLVMQDTNFKLSSFSANADYQYSPASSYGASWIAGNPPLATSISGIRWKSPTSISANGTVSEQFVFIFETVGSFRGTFSHGYYYSAQPLDESVPIYITVS